MLKAALCADHSALAAANLVPADGCPLPYGDRVAADEDVREQDVLT